MNTSTTITLCTGHEAMTARGYMRPHKDLLCAGVSPSLSLVLLLHGAARATTAHIIPARALSPEKWGDLDRELSDVAHGKPPSLCDVARSTDAG